MSKFKQSIGPIALGDQFEIVFPLQQADGSPWTPAATSAKFLAKIARDDDDAAAVISEQLGAGVTIAGSTATVKVEQEDQAELDATTTLYWSLRISTLADGEQTVGAGTLRLERFAVRT